MKEEGVLARHPSPAKAGHMPTVNVSWLLVCKGWPKLDYKSEQGGFVDRTPPRTPR
jgi:hypothetical protein